MKKTESKKLIPVKTVVKGLITGFVSYGIVISFLLFVIESVCYSTIDYSSSNAKVLVFSLPLLFAFIQYFVIHFICKLSTLDLFKKCKTKAENIDAIQQKMNLFFLICILVIFIALNAILALNLSNIRKSIDIASEQESKVFSEEYTNILKNDMMADYNEQKNKDLVIFIITELSLVVSFFSLIPYQRKMILEYNETGKRIKTDDDSEKIVKEKNESSEKEPEVETNVETDTETEKVESEDNNKA